MKKDLELEIEGTIYEYERRIDATLDTVRDRLSYLGHYSKECSLEMLATPLEDLVLIIDQALALKPIIKDLKELLKD